jgi:transcription elongation factor GreB
MSRAFVKEADDDLSADDLPERPLNDHPNYVTPRGLDLLHARLKELQAQRDRLKADDEPLARQKLLEIKRDIRYYRAQIERAEIVNSAGQPRDEVHFGATVTIRDEADKRQVFHIVGDDEADIKHGKISVSSPIARALIGKEPGESVEVQTPGGVKRYEIMDVRYE